MKHFLYISLFMCIFIGIFTVSSVFAQEIPGPRIELTATPTNPAPGETVSLYFAAYGTTLNPTTIRWYVNGTLFAEQTARISLSAGEAGSTQTIRVNAQDTSGRNISKDIVFQPAHVALLVEGLGSVPPFYRGASLVAKEGSYRVHAIPEIFTSSGQKISSTNLVYKWYINNQLLPEQSGLGKNSIFSTGTIITGNQNIRVEVFSASTNSLLATGNTRVTFADQDVYIYKDNSLYGVLFNTVFSGENSLETSEISLRAFPFFFSNPRLLSYNWKMNNRTLFEVGENTDSITLRSTEEGSRGKSAVSVDVSGSQTFLQKANASFFINF